VTPDSMVFMLIHEVPSQNVRSQRLGAFASRTSCFFPFLYFPLPSFKLESFHQNFFFPGIPPKLNFGSPLFFPLFLVFSNTPLAVSIPPFPLLFFGRSKDTFPKINNVCPNGPPCLEYFPPTPPPPPNIPPPTNLPGLGSTFLFSSVLFLFPPSGESFEARSFSRHRLLDVSSLKHCQLRNFPLSFNAIACQFFLHLTEMSPLSSVSFFLPLPPKNLKKISCDKLFLRIPLPTLVSTTSLVNLFHFCPIPSKLGSSSTLEPLLVDFFRPCHPSGNKTSVRKKNGHFSIVLLWVPLR